MARIGIISHCVDMIAIAQEVSLETGHELLIKMGIPNHKVIDKARSFQNECNVDAIIAQGPIYDKMHNHVDVPVIRMDVTNFELARALHQAFKIGSKVAYIDTKRMTRTNDIELVATSFGYSVYRISMDGVEETRSILDTLVEQQYDVVVTAAECIINQTPPSLHSIKLVATKNDLMESVTLAIQSIDSTNKKKEKIRWMQTIVDNIEEGILTCDSKGNVENFSASAEEITGITKKDLLGKNINKLLNNHIINSIYGDGKGATNHMISLDIGKLIVNRIPIFIKLEQRGLIIKIQKVAKIQELEQELRKDLLRKGFIAKANFDNIIGETKVMRDIKIIAKKYAASSSNIIISGESGSGKELFTQSIHNNSSCSKGPFVAVNCAALSESLLESELFGYEEGAFTGAKKGGKPGLFELAHGGTIFLDEIGDMPLSLQSRLLRVIQEKEVLRLGGSRVIPVKNRIICATNRNLAHDVEKGLFRRDLYYRINILQLHLPSLREHTQDIPLIAQAIFNKKCKKMKKNIKIRPEFLETLTEYHWPGNTREIQAFIERLLSIAEEPQVDFSDFISCFNQIKGTHSSPPTVSIQESIKGLDSGKILVNLGTMDEMETAIIKDVLKYVNGDKEKVEKILGISKTTLWRKMKKLPLSEEL